MLRNKQTYEPSQSFRICVATDGQARTGRLTTPHGVVRTPAFMPVGTAGAMKGMHWREVRDAGTDIVLGNTYHLMLRPGAERIAALGGLQRFTGWNGPMLTDSGGFQVMSLAQLRKVSEQRGDLPLAYRRRQGRAVARAFDRGAAAARLRYRHAAGRMRPAAGGARRYRARDAAFAALGRAQQARVRDRAGRVHAVRHRPGRRRARNCAGPARGAWSRSVFTVTRSAVSRSASRQSVMLAMIEEVVPILPQDRPRYLMGVGTPEDMLEAVARGVDMFDCVMPTRNGRHGMAFTRFGQINLRNARHADDPRPLDEESAWPSTRDISRAYLHHLVRSGETLGRDAAVGNQHRLLPAPDARHQGRDRRREHSTVFASARARDWAQGDIAPR